jgi:hypothetical protein
MERLSTEKYQDLLKSAIQHFWDTRESQFRSIRKTDQGNRSFVTGGKQMNGFVDLLKKIAMDFGIPESFIYTNRNNLPGFFRPTKDWDFMIISPKRNIVSVIELKSQVGSFGNNFNNRIEEALGSAVDLWTAFKENGYQQTQPPWLGYIILVEKTMGSTNFVKLQQSLFEVRNEFIKTSYLERYAIFCQKLIQERHYSAASLIWTNKEMEFGSIDHEISIESFLLSFMGYIHGKINEFEL